jgi:hypothetical protein
MDPYPQSSHIFPTLLSGGHKKSSISADQLRPRTKCLNAGNGGGGGGLRGVRQWVQ